jgi:UDPglucose--hexose-1-phosphate uridylyltransferase
MRAEAMMRRTARTLSDGREIIYFDHDDAPTRTVDDQRSLTDKAGLGELRYDPFTGEWIAVAGHRQTRIFLPSAAECPLCPSRDGLLSEIPDAQYDVVVFENRFPSLRDPEGDWSRPTAEWGAVAPAAGRCEVVCFSDDHNGAFKLLSPAAARLAIDAWVDRTAAMAALPYIRQVFPFENRGEEIGVTLHHPHGQIYGYSYVPPRMAKLMELAVAYRTQHHRHLIADVVAKELADGRRVIFEAEHWVAFVPIAARWPFEVQVHPRRGVHDFTELNDAEKDELAVLYPRLLRALDGLFDLQMPYVAAWFQAPFNGPEDERIGITMHLQLQTTRRAPGKLKFPAGSEMAMWAYISDVPAEQSAEQLRTAWERA